MSKQEASCSCYGSLNRQLSSTDHATRQVVLNEDFEYGVFPGVSLEATKWQVMSCKQI